MHTLSDISMACCSLQNNVGRRVSCEEGDDTTTWAMSDNDTSCFGPEVSASLGVMPGGPPHRASGSRSSAVGPFAASCKRAAASVEVRDWVGCAWHMADAVRW